MQYLSGAISTVGGILFTASFDIASLVVVGRLVSGLGHGLAFVTVITHGAENAIKEMRGRLISSTHFLIYSSVFTLTLVMMYTYPFPGGIRTEQMVGILAIGFSLMGIAFTPCLTYESITYLLYSKNEREALANMIKLRSESVVTWNISNDLQEMKLMVAEDREKGKNITNDRNLRPLLLMLVVSVVTALSSNLILNTNMIEVTAKSFMGNREPTTNEVTPNITSIAAVILVSFRYASGIVMILFGDSFSRKKFLRLSAGLAALSLLLMHILTRYTLEHTNGINWIPGVFAIAFQIFVGAGVEPMQPVLMSEAFSTAKKYWSIAFIAVVDSLMQIVLVGLSFIDADMFVTIFLYCSVVLIVSMTVILHKLPESRGISLRQARDVFTKTGIPEGITYS